MYLYFHSSNIMEQKIKASNCFVLDPFLLRVFLLLPLWIYIHLNAHLEKY